MYESQLDDDDIDNDVNEQTQISRVRHQPKYFK